MNKFVTKEFFDPVIVGGGPVETANYHWRFLHNCETGKVIIDAMRSAQESGRMTPIPHLEGRDFPEAHAFNEIAEHGVDNASPETRYLAATLLRDPLWTMGQDFTGRFIDQTGYVMDIVSFRKQRHRLVSKMNEFLNEPKLYEKDNKLPRSTDYFDGAWYADQGEVIHYLVRFEGWQPTLMARDKTVSWSPVDGPLEPAATPSP